MLNNLREYFRPNDLNEALALLRRGSINTVPLAGGTRLGLSSNPRIEAIVDLSELGLDDIEIGDTVCLGAMLRLQTLARDANIRQLAGGLLSEAARREGSYAVRNMATLGGCIAIAEGTSELLNMLLVLDATVELDGGAQSVALGEFLADKSSYLADGLITAVRFHYPGVWRLGSGRVAKLESDDPIVTAAAALRRDGDHVNAVRIAVGGIQHRPVRLPEVEGKLLAAGTLDAMIGVLPAVSDFVKHRGNQRGSHAYRRTVAPVVVKRALLAAWGEETGA